MAVRNFGFGCWLSRAWLSRVLGPELVCGVDGCPGLSLGAGSTGAMQLTAENAERGWPLRPGRYVARLLLDDGYAVLAECASFAVD